MKQWLLNIRQPGKRYTVWEGIRRILLCLVLGILLGMLAKQLDLASYGGNSFWERALEWLDLRNFLSDFPFWLAVGLAIAVFAPSAFQPGTGCFSSSWECAGPITGIACMSAASIPAGICASGTA